MMKTLPIFLACICAVELCVEGRESVSVESELLSVEG